MNKENRFPRAACASAFVLALQFGFHSTAAEETPDQIAMALGQKAIANSGAMELITDLTTEVGPRLAGSEGEKRAATWAKQRFEKLGYDKAWIETFPLEGWARGVEKAEVVGPSSQALILTALGSSVATPPEGLEAEIALFKTYEEFLAAPTNSIMGKIVVVTQPMRRSRDASGYATA